MANHRTISSAHIIAIALLVFACGDSSNGGDQGGPGSTTGSTAGQNTTSGTTGGDAGGSALAGTWTGTWTSTFANTGGAVSLDLNVNGDIASGTMTLQNSPCLRTGNFHGTIQGIHVEGTVDDELQSIAIRVNVEPGGTAIGLYQVMGGTCDGDQGSLSLTKS